MRAKTNTAGNAKLRLEAAPTVHRCLARIAAGSRSYGVLSACADRGWKSLLRRIVSLCGSRLEAAPTAYCQLVRIAVGSHSYGASSPCEDRGWKPLLRGIVSLCGSRLEAAPTGYRQRQQMQNWIGKCQPIQLNPHFRNRISKLASCSFQRRVIRREL